MMQDWFPDRTFRLMQSATSVRDRNELAAIPTGNSRRVETLLREMNIAADFDLGEDVWRLAATSFAAYAVRRRSGAGQPKRLPADFVIAAQALLKADRLMTLDANRNGVDFPQLRLYE
jgi:predicted nucleic acid-binding protein